MRCMRDAAGFEVCMHCGYVNGGAPERPDLLPPGTPLAEGRYLVGAAVRLNERETWYAGYDHSVGTRVHVRELFPRSLVARGPGSPVALPFDADSAEQLRHGAARFFAELSAVSGISCRNLVSVSDLFEENGTAYAVTEYLDGLILSDFLARNPATPAASAARNVSLQLCEGVRALHGAGLMHLGLGADAVWMCESGAVKLAAFSSVDLGAGSPALFLPETSPATAPPEALCAGDAACAPDIYSLAALMYRMFTGRFPDPAARGQYLPLASIASGADGALAAAVDRALSRDPAKRFMSVADFAAAFAGGAPAKGQDAPKAAPRKKGRAGRIFGFIASILLMLLGAALAFVYFFYLKK